MFAQNQYELLDFGAGRKLERFGLVTVDRPSPAAVGKQPVLSAAEWARASLQFEGKHQSGEWSNQPSAAESWRITYEFDRTNSGGDAEFADSDGDGEIPISSPHANSSSFCLEMHPTEFGHLGVFPEQASNWDWIYERLRRRTRTCRVLNLFAYTGGSTLAAALGGAEVVHVDAAKSVVAWARRNAKLSGMIDAPIRWIVEDAAKYVQREVRRGNQYDAIILDPPTYGHGPDGHVWKLTRDLRPLLLACRQLLSPDPAFLLLSCHTPGFDSPEIAALLADSFFGSCAPRVNAKRLSLRSNDGRTLPSGVVARWHVAPWQAPRG